MTQSLDSKIFITREEVKKYLKPRRDDAHKHTYGHVLLVCGSAGMSGAAILATGAALRSGCGLVTTHLPNSERVAIMARYPSAMLSLDSAEYFSKIPNNLEKYSAVGVGCGLGTAEQTKIVYAQLLRWGQSNNIPFVIDADALNLLAANPELLELVPYQSVMTPHDGELMRLVGGWDNPQHKISKIKNLAAKLNTIIVSKGPNTLICSPEGTLSANTSGNSGMAKGGSGDVLTGLIAGLIARGYDSLSAARTGVWLHGCAGDFARDSLSAEALCSTDILDFLPHAWKLLE